jgi:hypothetical protein
VRDTPPPIALGSTYGRPRTLDDRWRSQLWRVAHLAPGDLAGDEVAVVRRAQFRIIGEREWIIEFDPAELIASRESLRFLPKIQEWLRTAHAAAIAHTDPVQASAIRHSIQIAALLVSLLRELARRCQPTIPSEARAFARASAPRARPLPSVDGSPGTERQPASGACATATNALVYSPNEGRKPCD